MRRGRADNLIGPADDAFDGVSLAVELNPPDFPSLGVFVKDGLDEPGGAFAQIALFGVPPNDNPSAAMERGREIQEVAWSPPFSVFFSL